VTTCTYKKVQVSNETIWYIQQQNTYRYDIHDSFFIQHTDDDGKVDLRAVRINPTKKRKRVNDEPVYIALSSDEEEEDEEENEAADADTGGNAEEGRKEGAEGGDTADDGKGKINIVARTVAEGQGGRI
jgi:hypothetical protein